MTILIVGGTGEGRLLAARLVDAGVSTLTSLAGRTSAPVAVAGEVRVGGFGGPTGMAQWLRDHRPRAVVDASHPFAATMTSNTAHACFATQIPLLRLNRPSWRSHRLAGEWTWVPGHAEALAALGATQGTVWLTIGRQQAAAYASLAPRRVIARVAEARDLVLPDSFDVVEQRGPFSVDDERAFVAAEQIGALVSKDSGGDSTSAKFDAAHAAGIPVIMIQRPPAPPGLTQVTSVEEAERWVHDLLHDS